MLLFAHPHIHSQNWNSRMVSSLEENFALPLYQFLRITAYEITAVSDEIEANRWDSLRGNVWFGCVNSQKVRLTYVRRSFLCVDIGLKVVVSELFAADKLSPVPSFNHLVWCVACLYVVVHLWWLPRAHIFVHTLTLTIKLLWMHGKLTTMLRIPLEWKSDLEKVDRIHSVVHIEPFRGYIECWMCDKFPIIEMAKP